MSNIQILKRFDQAERIKLFILMRKLEKKETCFFFFKLGNYERKEISKQSYFNQRIISMRNI